MSAGVFAVIRGLEEPLSPISAPISRALSLSRFSAHFPLLLLSFLVFQGIQWISPFFLTRLSPRHYGRANTRSKHNWVVHVVSTVHAVTIVPLAFSCLHLPDLDSDRAFGFNERIGDVIAITCGYFLWDTLDCIVHFADFGFIVHGFSCLTVFGLGFRPFLGYYGARFLLWELSTPLLNFHWYLDKTNRTGGSLQLINGIIFLITFFLARICYGGLLSLRFFYTLQGVQSKIPAAMATTYLIGNVALQSLNWFWFYKIMRSLRGRFQSDTQSGHLDKNGHAVSACEANHKTRTE